MTEKLLFKALDFASKHQKISKHERDTILFAKRSLLFSDDCPWEKKSANNNLMFPWDHDSMAQKRAS